MSITNFLLLNPRSRVATPEGENGPWGPLQNNVQPVPCYRIWGWSFNGRSEERGEWFGVGGVGFPCSGSGHGKVRAEGTHSLEMLGKARGQSATVSPRRRNSQQTISASDVRKEQLQESWGFWFARRGDLRLEGWGTRRQHLSESISQEPDSQNEMRREISSHVLISPTGRTQGKS